MPEPSRIATTLPLGAVVLAMVFKTIGISIVNVDVHRHRLWIAENFSW